MSKIIVLTAGHSNTDPGAVNGSDREADIAQDIRNIVASILRDDYGLTVRTDGEGKGNLPLREAVKLIRGSDVAIEFHTNAAASKAATGVEALSTPKNKRWCQVLSRAVADATGWKLRGDGGLNRTMRASTAVWLMRRRAALCSSRFLSAMMPTSSSLRNASGLFAARLRRPLRWKWERRGYEKRFDCVGDCCGIRYASSCNIRISDYAYPCVSSAPTFECAHR